MSFEEFQNWLRYFRQRPLGWRDDSRIFKLMQVQGVKQRGQDVFASLAALAADHELSHDNPLTSLKGSPLFQGLMGARGGEQLTILEEL